MHGGEVPTREGQRSLRPYDEWQCQVQSGTGDAIDAVYGLRIGIL